MTQPRFLNISPDCVPADATLYIAVSEQDTIDTVERLLVRDGLSVTSPHVGVLAVECSVVPLHHFIQSCNAHLDASRFGGIRCCMPLGRHAPGPVDWMQSCCLNELRNWLDGHWLTELFHERRLLTHFQPIVEAENPQNIFAHECLLRGLDVDGGNILPVELFSAARRAGMTRELDELARIIAIESAGQQNLDTNIFVNFIPATVTNTAECLNSTIRAMFSSGIDPERFTYEVIESERIENLDQLLEITEFLREAGARVALDDIGSGYNSLHLLAKIKPDFIKLDRDLIVNVGRDEHHSRIASNLLELATDLNIKTVVEGVERPDQWQWLVENGADYAQGFLFAKPAAIPPESQFGGQSLSLDESLATHAVVLEQGNNPPFAEMPENQEHSLQSVINAP